MRSNRNDGPQWDAPSTLLPRVMKAIEEKTVRRAIPFYTWPVFTRLSLCLISMCALIGALFAAHYVFPMLSDIFTPLIKYTGELAHRAYLPMHISEILLRAAWGSKPAAIFLIVAGEFMTALWIGTVASFYYLLKNSTERRSA